MIKEFKNGLYVQGAVMAKGFVGLGIEWDNTDNYIQQLSTKDTSLTLRLLKIVVSVGREKELNE